MRFLRLLAVAATAAGAVFSGLAGQAQVTTIPRDSPLREGSFEYRDSRLGPDIGARSWLIFTPGTGTSRELATPRSDPKYNQLYPLLLLVRCFSAEDATAGRRGIREETRFIVRYRAPEDEYLARQVAAVLARVYWLGKDYLGVGPSVGLPVDVWISRDGQPGAEEYRKNIYLYAVQQARPPAEWVREICHEYSHAYLPRIGTFTKPEKTLSGYLGERLFMKWMLSDNRLETVWDKPIDGQAYLAKEVVPLREKWQKEGPASRLYTDESATGPEEMDYFIGCFLALEAQHGPGWLRPVLAAVATPRPQNLPLNVHTGLEKSRLSEFPLTLDCPALQLSEKADPARQGDFHRFRRLGFWLLLPGGTWRLEIAGTLPPGTKVAIERAEPKTVEPGAPEPATTKVESTSPGLHTWQVTYPSFDSAWRKLLITPPGGQTVDLRSIRVLRGEALP